MNQNNRRRMNGRTPVKRSGNQHAYQSQRKRKRKRTPSMFARAVFVFGGFTAMIALVFFAFGGLDAVLPSDEIAPTATATPEAANALADTMVSEPTQATANATATPESAEDAALLAEMLVAQEMLDDPFLILVSVNSLMPDDYVVDEVLADSTTGKTLDITAAYAYIDMAAAAANDSITLRLQSAYRSVSYQEGLFEAQIEKWIGWGYSEEDATVQAATVVNPPGASEHNCGLAADINCPDFLALEEGFEDTTAFVWLVENAADYGYILRYPKEDQDITGITYEPWHWRYVGVQNAYIINESGLCLEDFLIALSAVANGTATADVITGCASFQALVSGDVTQSNGATTDTNMSYEEAIQAGLDPEALGITPN